MVYQIVLIVCIVVATAVPTRARATDESPDSTFHVSSPLENSGAAPRQAESSHANHPAKGARGATEAVGTAAETVKASSEWGGKVVVETSKRWGDPAAAKAAGKFFDKSTTVVGAVANGAKLYTIQKEHGTLDAAVAGGQMGVDALGKKAFVALSSGAAASAGVASLPITAIASVAVSTGLYIRDNTKPGEWVQDAEYRALPESLKSALRGGELPKSASVGPPTKPQQAGIGASDLRAAGLSPPTTNGHPKSEASVFQSAMASFKQDQQARAKAAADSVRAAQLARLQEQRDKEADRKAKRDEAAADLAWSRQRTAAFEEKMQRKADSNPQYANNLAQLNPDSPSAPLDGQTASSTPSSGSSSSGTGLPRQTITSKLCGQATLSEKSTSSYQSKCTSSSTPKTSSSTTSSSVAGSSATPTYTDNSSYWNKRSSSSTPSPKPP
jgi:hypothetical protein